MDALTVPGSLDSLKAISQYVKDAAQKASLDKKTTYKLRLAVDEIATNIISYNPDKDDHNIFMTISSRIDQEKLFIIIEDKGIYFDPHAKITSETNNIDKPINERPIGKLGIYLAVDGVDEFTYERKNNKNYNTFVVNLNAKKNN